jgi:hypothetical protein
MKRFHANRTGFPSGTTLFPQLARYLAPAGYASAETAYVVRALSNIARMRRQSAAEGINRRTSMGFLFTLGSF